MNLASRLKRDSCFPKKFENVPQVGGFINKSFKNTKNGNSSNSLTSATLMHLIPIAVNHPNFRDEVIQEERHAVSSGAMFCGHLISLCSGQPQFSLALPTLMKRQSWLLFPLTQDLGPAKNGDPHPL